MPVIWQCGYRAASSAGDGALGTDGEVNPAATMRAATSESRIIPPGTHQRIVNCPAMVLKAEVDRLHLLPAIRVRTKSILVHDMWCHLTLLAPASVESVHPLELVLSRSRRPGGDFGHAHLTLLAQSGFHCANTRFEDGLSTAIHDVSSYSPRRIFSG